MTKLIEIKDYLTDKPNFCWYHFGPLSWGTKILKYKIDDEEIIIKVEEARSHEIVMKHIPDTNNLIEISGIWFNNYPLALFETEWLNVKPVIATMKVTVGDETIPSSFVKVFQYRDRPTAETVWKNTKTQILDENARILKSTDSSVTVVRRIESDILNDPELYIDNVRYLKKVHGLHPDHNSRVEKWEMNWK